MPTTEATLKRIKEIIAQLGEVMKDVSSLASSQNAAEVSKAHQLTSELFERLSVIKNSEIEENKEAPSFQKEPEALSSAKIEVQDPEPIPSVKEVSPVVSEPATLFALDPVLENVKVEPKKTAAKKSNLKKVDDLKVAIGLNERFRFINELFQGNQQEYLIAINQLNTVPDLQEAMIYFETLKNIYNWDTTDDCYQKLQELVQRRFV